MIRKLKLYTGNITAYLSLLSLLIGGCEVPNTKKAIENAPNTGRRKLDSSGLSVICPDSITITKSFDRHGGGFGYFFEQRSGSKFCGSWVFIPNNPSDMRQVQDDDRELFGELEEDSSYSSTLFNKPVTWKIYKGPKGGYIGLLRDTLTVTTITSTRAYLIQAADIISTLDRD